MQHFFTFFTFITLSFFNYAFAQNQPNIVLFLVDDMGWQDTSEPFLYDSNGNEVVTALNQRYRTPNIETLADKGLKFTDAYAMPVCTPTRISLMTGKNSVNHKVSNWTNPEGTETGNNTEASHNSPTNWLRSGLQNSEITLPTILKNAGYRTITAGKAHFGNSAYAKDPLNTGFDINIAGSEIGRPGTYLDDYGQGGSRAVPHLEEYHNTGTFLTEALTLEMNKAIEDAVNSNVPFYAQMAHYAVHGPFDEDPRFSANYPNIPTGERNYASLVEGIDKSLGDIVAKLEQLGVAEETVIVFMTDNGGDSPHDSVNQSNAPLRHKKGSKYEGGVRVPLIVSWAYPNSNNSFQDFLPVPNGGVENDIVACFDIFPTITGLANASYTHQIDGHDLQPYIAGNQGSHRPQNLLIHFPHDHRTDYYTIYREDEWKLIYNYVSDSFELYNLDIDISESNDLANSEPERVMLMARKMAQELDASNAQWPTFESNGQDDPFRMPDLPNVDIDGDGIPDNVEDANFNGLVDVSETDPEIADANNVGCDADINSESFESGWGIWNDGGSDARRQDNSTYASSGNFSAAIQDNTGTSVITTDNLNLSAYNEIEVSFNYYPVSMDNSNEDFWLQISTDGGSSFSTLRTWAKSTDFNNNTAYTEMVNVQGPFTSNTKIRFRCDASGNADDVYLDDIEIRGCNSNNTCAMAGQNCNDGDACTIGDVYDNNCDCVGTPSGDSDNDGICDANDNTNGNCTLNASCDDGDACTTGETYDANCNCTGGVSASNNSSDSLNPSDDTFIRGDSYAGNNYGSSTTIHIKKSGNDKWTRYGYLKFDLSAVNANQLQNAKLRLKVSSNNGTNVAQELLKAPNDNWTEDNLTWNNNQFGGTSISNFTAPAAGQWVEIDVTNVVQTEANGDDFISFAIISNNNKYIKYHTKESNGNEPELVLSYPSCNNNRLGKIEEDEINIYPNPASDFIYIDFLNTAKNIKNNKAVNLKIFSTDGRLLMQQIMPNNASIRMDVQALPSNEYYLMSIEIEGSKLRSNKFLKL